MADAVKEKIYSHPVCHCHNFSGLLFSGSGGGRGAGGNEEL